MIIDVLDFSRSVRHGQKLSVLEADLCAFAKAMRRACGATAIAYDDEARRFRVTVRRDEWHRLARDNKTPSGAYTMTDRSSAPIDYRYADDARGFETRRAGRAP